MHSEGEKGTTFVRYLQGLDPPQVPISVISPHTSPLREICRSQPATFTDSRREAQTCGSLRKLRESLLRELERIRTNVHRPLEWTVNFRHGNENQRQQKREDKHENEM
jgi:hypothetical protein